MIRHPVGGTVTLTLVLAAYFLASGMFRLVAAIAAPLPHRVWVAIGGWVSNRVGIMIWNDVVKMDGPPGQALMYIGLFVGIDLIFHGWAWVMFAFAAKRLPAVT